LFCHRHVGGHVWKVELTRIWTESL
jgi:hypothetical protein